MAPINIDIIMLSYAKDNYLRNLTERSILTLLDSEDPLKIKFNIVIIESQKDSLPYSFPNTQTIFPKEAFGYNTYMNIGIQMTTSPYICLCNNDLTFHKSWATEILNAFQNNLKIMSANPYCTLFNYSSIITSGPKIMTNLKYRNISGILTGWCIFLKRDIFKIIGLFDEQFIFWYADNDYGQTLKKHHIIHALIKSSHVDHLISQSHKAIDEDYLSELTYGQEAKFKEKWKKKSYIRRTISAINAISTRLINNKKY